MGITSVASAICEARGVFVRVRYTSIDFTASYPSDMVSEKFPMKRFVPQTVENMDEFEVLCGKLAVVFDARFEGVTPILEQENYLSVSKCSNVEGAVTNNGRIVAAKQFDTSLTEVDYEIMRVSSLVYDKATADLEDFLLSEKYNASTNGNESE